MDLSPAARGESRDGLLRPWRTVKNRVAEKGVRHLLATSVQKVSDTLFHDTFFRLAPRLASAVPSTLRAERRRGVLRIARCWLSAALRPAPPARWPHPCRPGTCRRQRGS